MAEAIRVLIADDHEVVRHGLQLMFESAGGFEVVGQAGSGADVVERVRALRPQVVLLDLRMPGLGGLEVLKSLKRLYPAPKVLILTGADGRHDVLEAIALGADGYALKQISPVQLQEAVRAVARGESYLHPGVTGQVLTAARKRAGIYGADPWNLSRRERDVLELMAQSLATDEMASRLFISEETVRTHIKAILKKTGKKHRMDAVLAAVAEGVVELAS